MLCLTLNFIFGYCSRACPDFCPGICHSRDHEIIGEKVFLTNPIKFGASAKRILC